MMLKPLRNDVIKKGETYYEFVIGIAKRARQIAEYADNERLNSHADELSLLTQRASEEKTVSIALEEYKHGEFSIRA